MTTTKKRGFLVTVTAFVEVDKTNFAKQAAAFSAMDVITKTEKLPADFWSTAVVVGIKAKQGAADVPDAPDADPNDPAKWPLTTDPLPDGATILEATDALDASIFQTIKLEDGTETFRRISAEQDATEQKARKKK